MIQGSGSGIHGFQKNSGFALTSTMTNFLELLYDALSSPYGIAIESPNPNGTKQALYRARKESGDLELAKLSIRSGKGNEVWIVRQER